MTIRIRDIDLFCWHCYLGNHQKNYDIVVIEKMTDDVNCSFCREHWDACESHRLQADIDYNTPNQPPTVIELSRFDNFLLSMYRLCCGAEQGGK